MALLRKLFKRNKRNCSIEDESSLGTENTTTEKTFITEHKIVPANISDTSLNEGLSEETEGTDIDEMVDKELYYKRRQLNNALRKARRHEERLEQRQKDVVAMDAEISELMWMLSLAKRQKHALEEEVLNKKCEMKFLRKEAPECCEAEVKKREPLFYKKYNNIKTSSDAKNMMHTVRQRQRALQYLELMVYNKYLELQYNIKSDDVKKRSVSLSKDKSKNFGHLVEALNLRSNFETQILNQTSNSETSSPTGPPLVSSMELDQISMHGSTSELPTTSVQTVSQASTPRDGATPRDGSTGLNGLVFHLATPPRENTRSPTPLLESFL